MKKLRRTNYERTAGLVRASDSWSNYLLSLEEPKKMITKRELLRTLPWVLLAWILGSLALSFIVYKLPPSFMEVIMGLATGVYFFSIPSFYMMWMGGNLEFREDPPDKDKPF